MSIVQRKCSSFFVVAFFWHFYAQCLQKFPKKMLKRVLQIWTFLSSESYSGHLVASDFHHTHLCNPLAPASAPAPLAPHSAHVGHILNLSQTLLHLFFQWMIQYFKSFLPLPGIFPGTRGEQQWSSPQPCPRQHLILTIGRKTSSQASRLR